MTGAWPVFGTVTASFVTDYLQRPYELFHSLVPGSGAGSGRPRGHRATQWESVVMLSVAALEGGLEDVVFAAHAVRLQVEGDGIVAKTNSPDANPRKWLVEDRLMAPGARSIERLLFADFGVLIDGLPSAGSLTLRSKQAANRGSARGTAKAGPANWQALSRYLDALLYVRHTAAHADARKRAGYPPHGEGTLWVSRADETWTIQMAHALSALRLVLSTYNTVAEALSGVLAIPAGPLTQPDSIDFMSA